MRVALETTDQLVLEQVPWGFGLTFGALFVLPIALGLLLLLGDAVRDGIVSLLVGFVLGGGGFLAFVRHIHVEFDRSADWGLIRRRTLFTSSRTEFRPSQVARAEAIRDPYSGRTVPHRPVLTMKDGTSLVIDPVYISGHRAQRTADRINSWLGLAPENAPHRA